MKHFIFLLMAFMVIALATAQAQDDLSLEDVVLDLESGEEVVLPPPVQETPPAVEISEEFAAPPAVDTLQTAETPTPSENPTAAVDTTNQPVETKPVPYSGLYYDSDAAAIGMGRAAPRQVDPKYERGSSFVVVEKSAGSDSLQARIVGAQRALQLGRNSAAMELYSQLYKDHPRNRQVLLGLAVAQQKSGFVDSAIATYEELLEFDANNHEAKINMLGLMSERYPAVAYRKLKDLWMERSNDPAIAAQLGLASAAIGDTSEAVTYLGIAASMEPSNPSHFYNMAVVTDRAGAYKDAIDYYEKALELDAVYGATRTIPRDQVYDRLSYLRRL